MKFRILPPAKWVDDLARKKTIVGILWAVIMILLIIYLIFRSLVCSSRGSTSGKIYEYCQDKDLIFTLLDN